MDNEDSDQTTRIHRMILVSDGASKKVCFVSLRLKYDKELKGFPNNYGNTVCFQFRVELFKEVQTQL